MFLIDGLPLYIGETNTFLARIACHLYAQKKNRSYFGLGNLEGKHTITYMILENGLPYDAIKENGKRSKDKNSPLRIKKQNEYIKQYKPLTQNPNYDIEESETLKRKKDDMIKNINTRNHVVKEVLEYYRSNYDQIIKMIEAISSDK